jgi:hypothetical protein
MRDRRLTEQRNPRSRRIDELDALGIVDLINAEDRMVAEAVGEERHAIARALELAEEAFRGGGRLVYVGAGTSGRLGVLDAAEMPPTYGTDPGMVRGVIAGGYEALVRAREGAEDAPGDGAAAMDEVGVGAGDFVLGIATSGTTPYVHGALDRARAHFILDSTRRKRTPKWRIAPRGGNTKRCRTEKYRAPKAALKNSHGSSSQNTRAPSWCLSMKRDPVGIGCIGC